MSRRKSTKREGVQQLKYVKQVSKMNRGEGMRYAAQAKSGQINLFKDEKKKTKKFGYKGRGQQFSVRKNQTQTDSQPTKTSQATAKKPATTKPQASAGKNRKQPAAEQKTKPPRKDFIKKNAQTVSSGKVKQEPTPAAGGGGSTVTLTQDQLNAILATIGKAAGNSEVPNISLENGDIKVKENELHNGVPYQNSQTKSVEKQEPESNNNVINTNGEKITDLLSKGQNVDKSTKDISPRTSKTPVYNGVSQPGPGDVHKKPPSRTDGGLPQLNRVSQQGESGYGDVSSIIGLNQRELAARKKQQWKKELDEQVALKQQQQVDRRTRGRNDDSPQQTWDPWGQSQNHRGLRSLNASMNIDLSGVDSAQQSDSLPMSSKSRDPMSSRITPRGDVTSSLGKIATQKYTPAAMRSSFIIGGDPLESHMQTLKQQEKKKWLEDLERQKREAKERKERERKREDEFHDRMSSQWAEQVTSPRSKSVAQPQQVMKPVATVDDSAITTQSIKQVEQSSQRHHSADAVPSKGRTEDEDLSNSSHARPHGLLVDPVEAERKELARQKHLEHMLAVKQQVEERQRQKREAMEAKKREEAEEERRLAEERDLLQKQFDMEKEKQCKKEEEAVAKQKAMMESVQAAYNQAQQEKHNKRLQRLAQQGHNVDNLRKSWDAKNPSPETSPRPQHPVSHSPVKHSPVSHSPVRLEPIITNAYTSSTSPRQVSNSVAYTATNTIETLDASTSPTFDQGVQTDFQFPPSDVLLERAFDIQREASAGIEYKPEKQNKKKIDKQKKVKDEGIKRQEKSKKLTKGKSQDISDEETNPKRTTNVKNRPGWGQGNQKKKKVGNSAKDLTGNQKKREERRKKRMEELLALQEQSAPKRLLEKKKATSLPQSRAASLSRAETTNARQQSVPSRPVTQVDVPLKLDQTPADAWTEDRINSRRDERRYGPPPSPPIPSGDFVPFLRHDEELIEHSIPASPDSRMEQRSRARNTPKTDKGRSSAMDEKDPLLNPERLKDTNLRQEKILEQLSNLRQGLMMKQRELEIGLSTTPLVM